ncbi:MAG: transcriptional regulator [Mesorhizobium sp.]
MNDNDPSVTLITGRASREKDGAFEGVHIMLVAPDDDTAVKLALQALTAEGYVSAELDRIGDMEGMPSEEPHASAYQGALEGEVAIVTFDEPF